MYINIELSQNDRKRCSVHLCLALEAKQHIRISRKISVNALFRLHVHIVLLQRRRCIYLVDKLYILRVHTVCKINYCNLFMVFCYDCLYDSALVFQFRHLYISHLPVMT
jgi:hypothetical protein